MDLWHSSPDVGGTNILIREFCQRNEHNMAVDKPTGDSARKGAVKKRTQLKNPLTKTVTKRNKEG
jgi:hypothetical protein